MNETFGILAKMILYLGLTKIGDSSLYISVINYGTLLNNESYQLTLTKT